MKRKQQHKSSQENLPRVELQNNKERIIGESTFFRYEIITALLSNKHLELQLSTKLNPEQINFIRFVDRITDGTHFEVSKDARRLLMSPGAIRGGNFSHQCVSERSIGYWIEAACLLCPFAKNPSEILFESCVTNKQGEIGFDLLRTATLPFVRKFGIEATILLKKRCCFPTGKTAGRADGIVIFSINNLRILNELHFSEMGFVKRIRGIAYGVKVAPDLCNYAATSAKGKLLKLLPDVYILTDINNKKTEFEESEPKSGYGLCLIAETTKQKAAHSAEVLAATLESPQDLAVRGVDQLMQEIQYGGAIDRKHQAICIFLMGLANDMPSKALFGSELTPAARYLLEHIFPTIFHIKFMKYSAQSDSTAPCLELMCIGSRLVNSFKQSF